MMGVPCHRQDVRWKWLRSTNPSLIWQTRVIEWTDGSLRPVQVYMAIVRIRLGNSCESRSGHQQQ